MSMPDHLLSSYDFVLPETQIAQTPPAQRGQSRLLVVRKSGPDGPAFSVASGSPPVPPSPVMHEGMFADILHCLPPRCLLVVNNTRVVPARLFGSRASGGRVEFLLLTPPPLLEPAPTEAPPWAAGEEGWFCAEAEGLLRSSKKVREGERVTFAPDFCLEMLERGEYGRCRVRLFWQGELPPLLERLGTLPLPPYIHREKAAGRAATGCGEWGSDRERYQTAYAREDKAGSVAAPTAGLHFTPDLLAGLACSGREIAEVTLYVGYGTFSPVRAEDIRDHAMHAEYVELSAEAVLAVLRAKEEGRAVVAVGTTATRALEGVYAALHEDGLERPALKPYAGWINIFLYPGKSFHIIDGLVTNFHLPRSSLLMLVSALTGRERMLAAYDHAVRAGFRFFSYGDAMLIV